MTHDRTALVVANATDADPGHVGERLEQRGFRLRTHLREMFGRETGVGKLLGSVDVVVLLGSEWSVHSPVDDCALSAECALVWEAMAVGTPVLGICYGAQVVAAACGAAVARAPRPEIGWIEVDSADPHLVPSGPWLAFHTDVISLPPDARVVARNGCGTQAFCLPGVLAVQFHPEVGPDVLHGWARRFPDLMFEAGLDAAALVAESRTRETEARAVANSLVDAFLDSVAGYAVARNCSNP